MKNYGTDQKALRILFNPFASHLTDYLQRHAMCGVSTGNMSFSTSPPPLLPEQNQSAQLRWSLARLIALVPKCIITPPGTFTDYLFDLSGDFVSYVHDENGERTDVLVFVKCNGDYIHGMVSIIIWLIQKGFLDSKYLRADAKDNV